VISVSALAKLALPEAESTFVSRAASAPAGAGAEVPAGCRALRGCLGAHRERNTLEEQQSKLSCDHPSPFT